MSRQKMDPMPHQARAAAGDDPPRSSDGLRDKQKDSGVSMYPPSDELLQRANSDVSRRQHLYAQSSRRSQSDIARWSSVSDDSAVDLPTPHLSFDRLSKDYSLENIKEYHDLEKEYDYKDAVHDDNDIEHSTAINIETNNIFIEDNSDTDTQIDDIDAEHCTDEVKKTNNDIVIEDSSDTDTQIDDTDVEHGSGKDIETNNDHVIDDSSDTDTQIDDTDVVHGIGKYIETNNDITIEDSSDIEIEHATDGDIEVNNDTDSIDNHDTAQDNDMYKRRKSDEEKGVDNDIAVKHDIEANTECRSRTVLTEPFDQDENDGTRRPRAGIFRRFFRWLCFYNDTSKADTSNETFRNAGFTDDDLDDHCIIEDPRNGFGVQTSPPEASNDDTVFVSDEVFSPDLPAVNIDVLKNVTLEKEDCLDLFDTMCSHKAMDYDVLVGRSVQFLNFAAALLDSRGGCLSIDGLGVHLYVPPGAIPADQSPQRLYIYVRGSLTSSYLTPYVQCGPSGFEFKKDVILILPHCAKDAVDTTFTCIKSSSGGIQTIEGGKDGIVIVQRDSILISMRHFCGLAAYGNPTAKSMVACVFVKNTNCADVMVRVRLFDDTMANLQEVQMVETKNGFSQVDMPAPMEMTRSDPEQDVKINLKCWGSWEVTEPQSGWQTIQHWILWRKCGPDKVPSFPSKLFEASMPKSSQKVPFEGILKVFQEGREDHGVDFVLNYPHNAAKAASPDQITKEQVIEICRQLVVGQLRGPATESRLLDEGTLKKLCELLDEPSPIGRDWHILPENLEGLKGHGHSWVQSIERRAATGYLTPQSPTELVLDAFFATASKESRVTNWRTLEELKCGLLSLKRPDIQFAIDVIDDLLRNNFPRKDNKTQQQECIACWHSTADLEDGMNHVPWMNKLDGMQRIYI